MIKYLIVFGLIPALSFPQLMGGHAVLAQENSAFETTEVFIESIPAHQLTPEIEEVDFSLQEQSFLKQPNAVSKANETKAEKPKQKIIVITAYSSTPDQTDSTPFITASGTHVRDGVVAANFLEFGAKVQFPEIYGDKIFVVEDRMAVKNSHKIDIWFPDRESAEQFGVKVTKVIIL